MATTVKVIKSRYPSRDTLVLDGNKLIPIDVIKNTTTVSNVSPTVTTTTTFPLELGGFTNGAVNTSPVSSTSVSSNNIDEAVDGLSFGFQ